jgi:hypothetical protein
MKEKPGMCIELVTVTRIELSPNNQGQPRPSNNGNLSP